METAKHTRAVGLYVQMAPALPAQQPPAAHPAASTPLVQLPPLWDLAAETEDASPVSSPKRRSAPVAPVGTRAPQPAVQRAPPAADRRQPSAAAVAAVAAEPLSDFICPITHCVFKDPVICAVRHMLEVLCCCDIDDGHMRPRLAFGCVCQLSTDAMHDTQASLY